MNAKEIKLHLGCGKRHIFGFVQKYYPLPCNNKVWEEITEYANKYPA